MFTDKYRTSRLTGLLTVATAVGLVVWTGVGPPGGTRSLTVAARVRLHEERNPLPHSRGSGSPEAEQALAVGDELPPLTRGDATRGDAALPGTWDDDEFVPGEILVGFRPGLGAGIADAVRQRLAATKIKEFAQIGVQHWRLPPGLTVDQAVTALLANPNVEYAEPNYIVHTLQQNFPNDPKFGDLWGLHNIGQTGGTADADIDAPEAWDIQTGSATIVVGVIDTGIDYNHEDLAANIWINPGEIAGNGIDDDNNGYIDGVRGWDFANDDNDPMDDHNHGSHTSGTIGAVGNNGVGVVGVNWTVSLMPLKFLNRQGRGTTADAIDAILYAASF